MEGNKSNHSRVNAGKMKPYKNLREYLETEFQAFSEGIPLGSDILIKEADRLKSAGSFDQANEAASLALELMIQETHFQEHFGMKFNTKVGDRKIHHTVKSFYELEGYTCEREESEVQKIHQDIYTFFSLGFRRQSTMLEVTMSRNKTKNDLAVTVESAS